jgi:thiol-disulfide isomerase/thioredoxin
MKKTGLIFIFILSLNVTKAQHIPSVKIEELEQLIKKADTPLVVNFWATFCAPCIKEMPYMIRITDSVGKIKPVKLIFVSLDLADAYPAGIQKFLTRRKINNPVYWLNETNADHFCPKIDAKWSGSIPATLFINNKTGYRQFLEKQMEPDEFLKEMSALTKE